MDLNRTRPDLGPQTFPTFRHMQRLLAGRCGLPRHTIFRRSATRNKPRAVALRPFRCYTARRARTRAGHLALHGGAERRPKGRPRARSSAATFKAHRSAAGAACPQRFRWAHGAGAPLLGVRVPRGTPLQIMCA